MHCRIQLTCARENQDVSLFKIIGSIVLSHILRVIISFHTLYNIIHDNSKSEKQNKKHLPYSVFISTLAITNGKMLCKVINHYIQNAD